MGRDCTFGPDPRKPATGSDQTASISGPLVSNPLYIFRWLAADFTQKSIANILPEAFSFLFSFKKFYFSRQRPLNGGHCASTTTGRLAHSVGIKDPSFDRIINLELQIISRILLTLTVTVQLTLNYELSIISLSFYLASSKTRHVPVEIEIGGKDSVEIKDPDAVQSAGQESAQVPIK